MSKYKVVSISASDFEVDNQLDGAIPKGWIETSSGQALFKIASSSSYYPELRTDWSEKIVSELAHSLQLPAARYELAQVESSNELIPGSISIGLLEDGKRIPLEEALKGSIDNYDIGSDYEVSNIIKVLEDWEVKLPPDYELPEGIEDGVDMFVGALVLDAYVSNIDRHHKNFDLIELENGTTHLSPIFDHGRSLGSFINDEVKENRSVSDYSESSKSFISVDGFKVNGLEVFAEAAKLRPEAAKIWLQELSKINPGQIRELFDRIPEEIITPISKKFATDLLNHNQSQLLSLDLYLEVRQDLDSNSVAKTAKSFLHYMGVDSWNREGGQYEIEQKDNNLTIKTKDNNQIILNTKNGEVLINKLQPKDINFFENLNSDLKTELKKVRETNLDLSSQSDSTPSKTDEQDYFR